MENAFIGLVELGGSHDECLLSQIMAIKSRGNRVLLICNQEILERHREYDAYIDDQLTFTVEEVKKEHKRIITEIMNKIKVCKPTKVVFNTAQGKLVRDLAVCYLFNEIEFIGVLHTTRKLKGSFTQKVINRKIKKYLLLSKFLLDSVGGSTEKLDYFYPLRFHDFNALPAPKTKPTVVLIGGVEKRRKDLDGFITMIKQLEPGSTQFIFLGKSDPEDHDVKEFRKAVDRAGWGEYVRLYDDFVAQETLDTVVKSADLILPLIHPDTPSSAQYFKNQISGAMIVSFAYKIPMMVHGAYRGIEEMSKASFYYQIDAFREALKHSLQNRNSKVEEMKAEREYDPAYQEERYLSFLFSSSKNS